MRKGTCGQAPPPHSPRAGPCWFDEGSDRSHTSIVSPGTLAVVNFIMLQACYLYGCTLKLLRNYLTDSKRRRRPQQWFVGHLSKYLTFTVVLWFCGYLESQVHCGVKAYALSKHFTASCLSAHRLRHIISFVYQRGL